MVSNDMLSQSSGALKHEGKDFDPISESEAITSNVGAISKWRKELEQDPVFAVIVEKLSKTGKVENLILYRRRSVTSVRKKVYESARVCIRKLMKACI